MDNHPTGKRKADNSGHERQVRQNTSTVTPNLPSPIQPHMEISWSAVRPAITNAFQSFNQQQPQSFTAVATGLYHNAYRPTARTPSTEGKKAVIDGMKTWQEFADNAQTPSHSSVMPRVILQNNKDGETNAVLSYCNPGSTRSRLQIVIKAEYVGQGLMDKLSFLSTDPVVAQWKIMNPELASTGPDSAVIYLLCPFSDGNVERICDLLEARLGNALEDLTSPPLGLTRKRLGIYGFAVPSSDKQENILHIPPNAQGSAGTIISNALTKAAHNAFLMLHDRDDNKRQWAQTQAQNLPDYLRGCLKHVLGQLNWRLID